MKYAFKNGIVIDGTRTMEPKTGLVVLTEDTKIAAVISEDTAFDQDFEIIDLNGQYIMPGLINIYGNLCGSGNPKKSMFPSFKKNDKKHRERLSTALKSGITTYMCADDFNDYVVNLRNEVNENRFMGPRMFVSGHSVSLDDTDENYAQEAVHRVRAVSERKPDFISLDIFDHESLSLKMGADAIRSACLEAQDLNLSVISKAENTDAVRVALKNGIDAIVHGASQDMETLALYKNNHAFIIPALSSLIPKAFFDKTLLKITEIEQYNAKVVYDGAVDGLKTALENNIPIGIGTDAGNQYVTHYNMWRELVYLSKALDMDNRHLLYLATSNNAQLLGMGNVAGTVKAGKFADLLILRENPLENLEALKTISKIIVRGELVENLNYKSFPKVDELLDKYM